MKYRSIFLITAAVLGLAGTAWADVPLAVKQRAEQQVEANRKALEAICAPHCTDRDMPSNEDWEAEKARLEKIWTSPPLTLQQQIEANRKAAEETCAPNCKHPFYEPSQEEWEATAARLSAETEVHLRKMGMSPRTAKLAAWAGQHRPYSACAHYVAQLTADYENGEDRPDYDDNLIISIEHSGTCERKNLD